MSPHSALRNSPGARRGGQIATIALERGALRFASPEFLQHEFGILPGPPPPYLAAYEIEVAGLDRARNLVERAGLPIRPTADGAAVTLPPSLGGTIVFRARAG
jgi:hypothetical protein